MKYKNKIVAILGVTALLCTSGTLASKVEFAGADDVFMSVDKSDFKERDLYDNIMFNASYQPVIEVLDLKVLKKEYEQDKRLAGVINEKFNDVKEQNKETDKNLKKEFARVGASNKDDYIIKSGLNLEAYRELARIDTASQEIFSKSEVQYVYDNMFSGTGEISRILIEPEISIVDSYDETKVNAAKQEALKKAENIKKEIAEGLSFEDASKKYSDDKKNPSGKLGSFDVNSARSAGMNTRVVDAVFSLENEEVSAPIQTDFGYEILTIKYSKEKKTFEELKNEVNKKLYEIYKSENSYISEYAMDLFRKNNNLELTNNAHSQAYANAVIQNRKSFVQFDPNNQMGMYQ